MRKLASILIAIALIAYSNIPATSAESLKWSKLRTKPLSWPSKGKANSFPAYRHLSSPSEDFLNFSYLPSAKYRLLDAGQELEINIDGSVEKLKGASKIALNLAFPTGVRKTTFDVYPPGDNEHQATAIDRLQWKIRNSSALSISIGEVELLLLDADANGHYFDYGVDKVASLSSAQFAKGEFDPETLKWSNFSGVFTIGDKSHIVAGDMKGNVYGCRLPSGFDTNTAVGISVLNDVRAQHGLDPVLPDLDLSELLKLHCTYCSNAGFTLEQDPKSYYYDSSAAKVARFSYTTSAANANLGMRSALSTLYARNMLLHPDTKSFGVAFASAVFCVGGVKAAWEQPFTGRYPYNGQRRVYQRYINDLVSPYRVGEESFCGTFIVLGGLRPEASLIEASLTEFRTGAPLKVSASSPTDLPNDDVKRIWPDNKKGITLIPNEPLRTGLIYCVKIVYRDLPTEPEKTAEWMFATEEPTPR